MLPALPDGLGEAETTRQHDLRRLVDLAREFDDGSRTVADFVTDLQNRMAADAEARGVHLLTYHRAKASSSTPSSCRGSRSTSCPSASRPGAMR